MSFSTKETSAFAEECTVKGTHWVKQMVKTACNYAYWAKDAAEATSATADNIFFALSFTYTGTTGSVYGMRIDLEQTSVAAGAPRALTLRTDLKHTSGHAPQGANCVDAQAQLYGTGNDGISGEMHAMESKLRIGTVTTPRVVQGTYAAHKFTIQIKDDNTMPTGTYFCRFYDVGTLKSPFLFGFSGLGTAADDATVLFRTGGVNGNGDEIKAGLRCNINGTVYYIACIAATDWSDS